MTNTLPAALIRPIVTHFRHDFSLTYLKGANPQRVSTEIIIEIKQLYPGQMALNPFIASNRRYKVFPLRDTFTIENGLLE